MDMTKSAVIQMATSGSHQNVEKILEEITKDFLFKEPPGPKAKLLTCIS